MTVRKVIKVVVTGGSGKAGRAVIRDLINHGYDGLNVDRVAARERLTRFLQTDLSDLGQTFEALPMSASYR